MIIEISPFYGAWPTQLRKYYNSVDGDTLTVDDFNARLKADGYNVKMTGVYVKTNDNEEIMLTAYNMDFESDADYTMFMLKWS